VKKLNEKIETRMLSEIKEILTNEFLKRGVTAPIETIKINYCDRGYDRVEFQTEKFQTQPVIFKEIRVGNFNSSITEKIHIREDKTEVNYLSVWIQVNYAYKHFSRGSNGCEMFTFNADVDIETGRLWEHKIR